MEKDKAENTDLQDMMKKDKAENTDLQDTMEKDKAENTDLQNTMEKIILDARKFNPDEVEKLYTPKKDITTIFKVESMGEKSTFVKWCRKKLNKLLTFTPFNSNDDVNRGISKCNSIKNDKNEILWDKSCTDKFGQLTLFFGFYEELKEKLVDLKRKGHIKNVDELWVLLSSILGLRPDDPFPLTCRIVLLEVSTFNLLRPCKHFPQVSNENDCKIKKQIDLCKTTEYFNVKQTANNNSLCDKKFTGYPFTGNGKTLFVNSKKYDAKNKHGVNEVVLSQDTNTLVTPVGVMSLDELMIEIG